VDVSVVRRGIDSLVTLAAHAGRRRRLNARALVDGPAKINLGSSLEIAPGWINVDASLNALIARWPSPFQAALYSLSGQSAFMSRDEYLRRLRGNRFVHCDLTRTLPFVDSSADFVFSSHFLEHLTRAQCVHVLAEARRVLGADGVIRVAVPDLDVAIELYAQGETRHMLDHHFYRPAQGKLAEHRYMYNFPLLAEALNEAGFADVRRCAYREGVVPDLEHLDNRPDETLFVEASGVAR
jgi:SAM-dependent methyltransferase